MSIGSDNGLTPNRWQVIIRTIMRLWTGGYLRHTASISSVNLNYYPLCNCVGNLQHCPRGFTLAVWIKISLLDSGDRYYFSSGGQTTSSHGVALYTKQYKFRASFRTNGRAWGVGIADVTVDVWFHIIITWDTIHARFYKNGCLAATASVVVQGSTKILYIMIFT